MGNILQWIAEVVGSLIGVPFVWVDIIFGTNISKDIIEPIMAFLGFTDEDIYSTDVIAVRVYDEDLYTKVMQQLHLEYMKKGYGSIDYAKNFVKTGENQFGRYYRTGKWDYMDYLPEGQINAVSLDRSQIVAALQSIEGIDDIFIVSIINRTPPDEVWAKFQLQELYNYNVGTDALQYTDGQWYKYTSTAYISSNNTFNVTIDTIPVIDAKTYTVTTVTVTPIDDNYDNKNTLVTTDVLYTDNATGNVLYKTSTVVSNTDEQVSKGTVSESYTNDFVSEVDTTITPNTVVINMPTHSNTMYYVVEYTRQDTGQFKYWLYNPASGTYPIDSPLLRSNNFELMPIVMLRNNKVDVADMDEDSNRYKQTFKMLKSIGVDLEELTTGYKENPDEAQIQDAFFLLGVSPSDTEPIVSRYLYEMFDAIYNTSPFAGTDVTYSMSVKEEPFNAALVWNTGDVDTHNGTIYAGAMMGDCKHEIHTFTTVTNTYSVQVVTALDSFWFNPYISVQQYTQVETLLDGVLINTSISGMTTFNTYQLSSDTFYPIGTTKTLTSTDSFIEKGMIIQKQLTNTTYRRIDIRDFKCINLIRSDRVRGMELPLDDKDLIIPLAIPVLARLTLMEKTALLGRSVHMIFYAVQHTHLEWYETSQFVSALQAVMIVIMVVVTVVVTVVTWGTGTAATITAMDVLYTLLQAAVISVAVQLALKLIDTFVDDPALKATLSLVVMAIGIYASAGFDFSAMGGVQAVQLVSACVEAANIYVGEVLSTDTEGFQQEVGNFNQQYEERSTQQQKVMDGLGMGSKSFDMVSLSTDIDMFNTSNNRRQARASLLSPNQFYYLATNQAAYNYDLMYTGLYDNAVHNFVANRLQLGIPGA